MANKTTWAAVVMTLITLIGSNLDRVGDLWDSYWLGIDTRRVAEAQDQLAMWNKHVGKQPVDIVTVKLPKDRIVQCQPYSDGDTLVVSQDAAGESKSVWVPLTTLEGRSSLRTAYAASRRVFIRKVCATRRVFHKSYKRNVIMQVLKLSNGRCVARLIDPARKGKVLSQVATRCPRGCG